MPYLLRNIYRTSKALSSSSSSYALIIKPPELVFIDFECDKRHNIIEITALLTEGQEAKAIYKKFIPIQEYNPDHITQCTLSLIHLNPNRRDIFKELLEFIGGRTMVAHNSSYDKYLLSKAITQYNLGHLDYLLPQSYICTLNLSRRLFPDCTKFRLQDIISFLNLPRPAKYHRAEHDCMATVQIFCHIQNLLRARYKVRSEYIVPLLEKMQEIPKKRCIDMVSQAENDDLKTLVYSFNIKKQRLCSPI